MLTDASEEHRSADNPASKAAVDTALFDSSMLGAHRDSTLAASTLLANFARSRSACSRSRLSAVREPSVRSMCTKVAPAPIPALGTDPTDAARATGEPIRTGDMEPCPGEAALDAGRTGRCALPPQIPPSEERTTPDGGRTDRDEGTVVSSRSGDPDSEAERPRSGVADTVATRCGGWANEPRRALLDIVLTLLGWSEEESVEIGCAGGCAPERRRGTPGPGTGYALTDVLFAVFMGTELTVGDATEFVFTADVARRGPRAVLCTFDVGAWGWARCPEGATGAGAAAPDDSAATRDRSSLSSDF
jgi:hypothetical protein